ncbi:unnamed protein product [Ectocarpus sp. 4 AP-2014]
MEARPPVPLRLSVEERVEHAVSSAVRRALAEQRKTQEEELDSLSYVLQRSLAALAGERDRALRSLAAEEDRRRDMIEELTSLLGGELSCGDVSRLAMGLERIEREAGPAAASEEEGGGGQERGRVWVLERVEQLEALALEARRGDGKKRATAVALAGVGEGGGAGESVGSAELADGLDGGGGGSGGGGSGGGGSGGGGGGDRAVEGVGGAGGSASSDGSWSFPSCSQEGAADRAEETGRPAAGSVEPGGDGGACTAEATAEGGRTGAAATRPADEAAADKQAQEPRGGATAGRAASSGGGGDDGGSLLPVKTDHASDGGEGGSGSLVAAPGGGDAQPPPMSSEPGEVERWRMAARRSEASLADLLETLGNVLALSFMCGEESARRRGEEEEEAGGVRFPTEWGVDKEAGCGDPDSVLGVVAGLERVGDAAAAAAAAESSVSEEAVEGTGGTSDGTSRGRERFSPGEAKAAAVDVLLKRLEALSVDQGGDIARLEASLQALRGSSSTLTAGAAVVSSSGNSGRGDLGGSAQEESAQAAAGLKAEDVLDPKLHSPAAVAAAVAPRGEGDQEGGVSNGEAGQGGRGSRDASPNRDIRTEWEELDGLDTHLGHYQGGGGLGSQAVQGVLDRWIDVSKRNILEGWLGHVLHGGPVDSANGSFVPRVQMSSLSKEVRDGMVSVVLPLLLGRRGVLLQVLTRERVELVHDVQIRVTPVAGRRDAPPSARASLGGGGGSRWRPAPPVGEREHGARIRDMVMKAAHVGYVEEDEGGGGGGGGDGDGQAAWRTPLASVDSLSRQLKDTWETFNANFATMAGESRGEGGAVGGGWAGGSRGGGPRMLPEY